MAGRMYPKYEVDAQSKALMEQILAESKLEAQQQTTGYGLFTPEEYKNPPKGTQSYSQTGQGRKHGGMTWILNRAREIRASDQRQFGVPGARGPRGPEGRRLPADPGYVDGGWGLAQYYATQEYRKKVGDAGDKVSRQFTDDQKDARKEYTASMDLLKLKHFDRMGYVLPKKLGGPGTGKKKAPLTPKKAALAEIRAAKIAAFAKHGVPLPARKRRPAYGGASPMSGPAGTPVGKYGSS